MPSPPFSPALALSASSLMSLTYVLGLYFQVPARIRALERNDPEHIRARALSAITSSAVAMLITVSSVYVQQGDVVDILRLMGLRGSHVASAALLPLGSFVLLFTGPLAQVFVLDQAGYNWFPEDPWINMRNLVVAPVTEEFVFRSCVGTTMVVVGGFSWSTVVFGAPLFFGLAHVHHGIASVLRGEPASKALLAAAFQTVYTTLFGALEMHVFLRTGHLLSAVAVHSWCNFMGLPRVDLVFSSPFSWRRSALAGSAYIFGVAAFVLGAFDFATDPAYFKGMLWKKML